MAVTSPTGNIFADAAVLARHAYDDGANADTALGWAPVDAATLGLAQTGTFDGGTYAFLDGIYVGTDQTNGAVAHVSLGELNGETVLAVAFRGTDEVPGDLYDHLHFSDHAAQFAPLLDAVDSYADEPVHGVDRVLLTGHSLGSAMVTTAMIEQGWINDPQYLGVAIAAHGTDADIAATAPAEVDNLVNFIHTQDFLVLAREDGLPANTIADLIGGGPLIGDEFDFAPKARVGTDVWIETGNAVRLLQEIGDGRFEDPVTAEHRIGRYEADITTLAAKGELDPSSLPGSSAPHYFVVGTEDDDLLVQSDPDFFPTRDFGQHIYGGGGDDRLAGAGGDDFIDGGAGTDTAYFRDVASAYTVTTSGGATTVDARADATAEGLDMLVDVESLGFADGEVSLAGVGDDLSRSLDNLF